MKKLMILIYTFLSLSLCASSTVEQAQELGANLIEAPVQTANDLLSLTASAAKESGKRTYEVLTGNDLQPVEDTQMVRPLVISPQPEEDVEEDGIPGTAGDQEDNEEEEEEGLDEIPFE